VLIHAGAGGVGHVAIQLAKLKGARVITTVSSRKKQNLLKVWALMRQLIIQKTFCECGKRSFRGKGADLVFDTVGAAVFKESIAVTAILGRLVTLLDR